MLEIHFGDFPVLETEKLVLRQIDVSDAESLFRLRSNPEVMLYFGRPPMKSVDEAREFITSIQRSYVDNESILWVLSLPGDTRMIGTITIWKIDKANHRAEIGYMLDPRQQGKGFMSAALTAMLQYGFKILNLHSVEANVNPENEASIKLLERNGFVREAYFRENYYFDGKFEDSAIYSLIAPA